MPRRKFVYSKEHRGVVEITPEEDRPLCAEIHEDAVSRTGELQLSGSVGRKSRNATCWPIYSDATGVNPDQIPQAQEKLLREHGVFTEFCPKTGRAILRDKAHKKAHYEATGNFDGDAGYGDATPKNFTGGLSQKQVREKAREEYRQRIDTLYRMLNR